MRIFGAKKEDHFIEAYKKHFAPFRDKPIRLLEIGVQNGGSMKMWESYFPFAEIVGVDNDSECLKYETDRTSIHIGDQADRAFLRTLGKFDIIVDDGGHKMSQQMTSFDVLFNEMNPGGIYTIEDLHTSFMEQYKDAPTTTEFLCSVVNTLCDPKRHNTYGIRALSVYKSLCFIEKV